MSSVRRAARCLALLCAVACATAACLTDGPFSQGIKARLLRTAPAEENPKIVTLEVDERRGRLIAEEQAISYLERARNVYAVRRGTGRNTVYVVIKGSADPYSLAYVLPDTYTVRVLAVESIDDL